MSVPAAQPKPKTLSELLHWQFGRASAKDWYLFCLELQSLISAGLGFIEATALLAKTSERGRVKRLAARLSRHTASGGSMQKILDCEPDMPPLMRTVLMQGLRAGTITRALDVLIQHYKWLIEMRSHVRQVVWYPLALAILGTGVMAARDAIIMDIQGTAPAQAWARVTALYMCPLAFWAMMGALSAWLINSPATRGSIDGFLLKIPVLGSVLRKFALSVFFNTFAASLDAGMSVLPAYELAADATPNKHITARLLKWTHFLRDGESIATTLKHTGVLDQDAVAMVAAGEVSARVGDLMTKLADYYANEIRTTIKMTIAGCAPFLVIAIAIGYFVSPAFLHALVFAIVFLMFLI
jgi:type II secretory pathway component PulF